MVDYLSRASVIRLKLESYGDTRDDRTMSTHIARNITDSYERVRDFLLLDVSLPGCKLQEVLRTASHEKQRSGRGRDGSEERITLFDAGAGRSGGASRAGGLNCWERDRKYPPGFICQIHRDNSNHDTSDCIVLRKQFVMLFPEFKEYRRRRQGAAATIGGTWIGARDGRPASEATVP